MTSWWFVPWFLNFWQLADSEESTGQTFNTWIIYFEQLELLMDFSLISMWF